MCMNLPATANETDSGQMTLMEALELGVRYQRANQLNVAEAIYGRVLEVWPQCPDAVQFLGVLAHQRGTSEAAVRLMHEAIELAPENARYWNNLGNIYFESRHWPEAMAAYERSIELGGGASA